MTGHFENSLSGEWAPAGKIDRDAEGAPDDSSEAKWWGRASAVRLFGKPANIGEYRRWLNVELRGVQIEREIYLVPIGGDLNLSRK
jgi:hypothetical protein